MKPSGRIKSREAKKSTLAEYPFPRALADLKHDGASGFLELRSAGMAKSIYLKDGVPAHIETNVAEESLEHVMVRRGEIEESVAFAALNTAISRDQDIASVLIEMGAIRPDELFSAMKRRMGMSILGAFAWRSGEIWFEDGDELAGDAILLKVSPGPLVVRGVSSHAPIETIQSDFPDIDEEFAISKSSMESLGDLRLNTVQSRMANVLAKPTTVGRLAERARVDPEDALRMLYALVLLRVARRADELHDSVESDASETEIASEPAASTGTEPAQEPAVAPEEPPTPEPANRSRITFETPAGPPRLTPGEMESIDSMYLRSKTCNYFELFGVEPNCTFEQLKVNFFELCSRFSPMAYGARPLGQHGERVEGIFLTLVTAFSTLAAPGLRKQYAAQLKNMSAARSTPSNSKVRRNAFAVDVPKSASAVVQTAVTFLNAGEPKLAVETLQEAGTDSTEALVPALLGYALYLSEPGARLPEARRFLDKASSVDPRCLEAHLFLARISEVEQDLDGALAAYRECVHIDPTHAESVEAVRRIELRNR